MAATMQARLRDTRRLVCDVVAPTRLANMGETKALGAFRHLNRQPKNRYTTSA